jgi:tetrahydromethanopterin S-methyltransferase subunit F
MPPIDWLAVIVAALAAFAVGSVWYSPLLFTKAWQRESGMNAERAKGMSMPLTFAGCLGLIFLASLAFAFFLGPGQGWRSGALYGCVAGLFWVTGYLGVNYLFERRSLTLFLINGGYNVASFTIMGAVLGAMY